MILSSIQCISYNLTIGTNAFTLTLSKTTYAVLKPRSKGKLLCRLNKNADETDKSLFSEQAKELVKLVHHS